MHYGFDFNTYYSQTHHQIAGLEDSILLPDPAAPLPRSTPALLPRPARRGVNNESRKIARPVNSRMMQSRKDKAWVSQRIHKGSRIDFEDKSWVAFTRTLGLPASAAQTHSCNGKTMDPDMRKQEERLGVLPAFLHLSPRCGRSVVDFCKRIQFY